MFSYDFILRVALDSLSALIPRCDVACWSKLINGVISNAAYQEPEALFDFAARPLG
ncbi:MAG TPA: hypothetical protein VJ848_09325 [Candidatus Angelobacter sp.]|nr:hypothetical protein [Candidatus Angelobacter sp.]